ncbi:MAG: hypothetical protein Q9207_000475 [Kuettlingeria erythrocarpa]
MPSLKLLSWLPAYPRCTYRAAFATLRSRKPPPCQIRNASSTPPREPGDARRESEQPRTSAKVEATNQPTLSDALRETKDADNSLLSPVHIPEDPSGVLNEKHPAATILANSSIVVQRQLELMNVMVGFEQANKYVIVDPHGNHIGFIAEQDNSMGKTMARQMFSTHRSFTTHVFDKHEREVLRFHRPFSWVSSRIGVYDPVEVAIGSSPPSTDLLHTGLNPISSQSDRTSASSLPLSQMRIIGEAQQQWAPLRRKYNLFLFHQSSNAKANLGTRQISSGDPQMASSQQPQVSETASIVSAGEYNQFAYVDEPFLSLDFSLRSVQSELIGSVNRNWGGIVKEIFADIGTYALRMDAAGLAQQRHLPGASSGKTGVVPYDKKGPGMTLDQRAVMLATAVSIDFDYFSRHSGAGGGLGWMPLWFPMGGGEAAATGEVAEGAGAIGEAGQGSVIRGADLEGSRDAGVGTAVGMGSMAGYETMQRGAGRGGADDALPTAPQEEMLENGEPRSNEGDWTWGVDASAPSDRGSGSDGYGGEGADFGDSAGEPDGEIDEGDFFDF